MTSTHPSASGIKRANTPTFSNPFTAPRISEPSKAYPSLATPFDQPRHTAESTTSSTRDPNSPLPDTPGSFRSRTSSFFQSISFGGNSASASPSDRKGSIFSRKGSTVFGPASSGSGAGSGPQRKDSVAREYMLESQGRPMLAPRRASYVPKYAAQSHLASMSGRTSGTHGEQMTEQLRRGSRMMSIVPGEMGAPSRLIHSAVPEVEGGEA